MSVDLDLQDKLIHAIWREKIVDVEVLLNSGADVNAAGSQGRTPLMQAAEPLPLLLYSCTLTR